MFVLGRRRRVIRVDPHSAYEIDDHGHDILLVRSRILRYPRCGYTSRKSQPTDLIVVIPDSMA